jgi:hypothetical protein
MIDERTILADHMRRPERPFQKGDVQALASGLIVNAARLIAGNGSRLQRNFLKRFHRP